MGAFDAIPNITIPDPDDPIASAEFRHKWKWESYEQVILRGQFTAGDQEAITNASMSANKKGTMAFHAGTGRLKLMEMMIIGWTFKHGGRDVPVTLQNIKRLPANYTNPILEKCDELAQAMTEEEQEDFLDSVNGHMVESSIMMR